MMHIISAIVAATMNDAQKNTHRKIQSCMKSDGDYDEFPHGYCLDEYRKPIEIPKR